MARINAQRARNREQPMASFCPLDLTSKQPEKVYHVASLIMQPGARDSQINRFTQWLEQTDILDNLKARQIDLDSVGVMNGDVNDERLLAAMTLRDCTVFVKSTSADPGEWEARIGDLDLKSKDKIGYWRAIEKQLIDEGWYQGSETRESRQPLLCRLNRDSVPRPKERVS
jgi:inositol-pentakisphosphate 2-kinase